MNANFLFERPKMKKFYLTDPSGLSLNRIIILSGSGGALMPRHVHTQDVQMFG